MKYPMLFLLIACVSGIFAAKFLNNNHYYLILSLVIFAFIIFSYFQIKKIGTIIIFISICTLVFFVAFNVYVKKIQVQQDVFADLNNAKAIISAKIERYSVDANQNMKLVVKVNKINNQIVDQNLRVSLIISDYKESNYDIKYGSEITTLCKIYIPGKKRFYGDTDYNISYLSKNIYASMYVVQIIDIKSPRMINLVDSVNSILFEIRQNIIHKINRYLNFDQSSLLVGMLLGDKAQLSSEIQDNLSVSGISYIVVVAGLQIGIILMGLGRTLSVLKMKKQMTNVISIILIAVFGMMVGPSPSILRAIIMVFISYSAILFNRKADSINNLIIAALVILLYNPFCLFSPSFLLSFGSTAGIIFIVPIMQGVLQKKNKESKNIFVRYFIPSVLMSFSSALAMLPFIFYYANHLSIIFFLISAIIYLPIQIIIIVGILFFIIPIEAFNFLASKILRLFLNFIILVSNTTAKIKFLIVSVSSPRVIHFIAYYLLLFGILYLWKMRGNQKISKNLSCF